MLVLGRDRLPAELLDQPRLFQDVLEKSGLGRLQSSALQPGPVRLTARGARSAEGRLVRQIEEGRFHPVAEELAADPSGFAGRLKTEYENGLRHCDELLRGGNYQRALRILGSFEDVFGSRPEIQFRQAIAEIQAGHRAHGARLANQAMKAPAADLAKLYEEINIRLSKPAIDPITRENLARVGEAVAWRDLTIAGKVPPGDVVLAPKGEHVGLEFHAAQELPLGEPVPLERVLNSDAPIYIQDSPGLNNLDWSPSARETLPGLIQGKLAKIVNLADMAIAEFQPSRVFAGKASASSAAKPVGYIKVRSSAGFSGPPIPTSGLSAGTRVAKGDEDEETKRKKRFEALRAGGQGAARAVFVVVPATDGR
jgi:hypothetical protein